MLQQTNGHNHPVDGVEAQVERVKHKLRKRAREEVTPIPSIYNDALVDIAANSEEGESWVLLPFCSVPMEEGSKPRVGGGVQGR